MVQGFLSLMQFTGQPTPVDRILYMKAYGIKLSSSTKGRARVSWKDGSNEVCIDSTSFTMAELRIVVHGLHETCRDRLVRGLMFLEEEELLPKLEVSRLYDNPAELVEGWNFL